MFRLRADPCQSGNSPQEPVTGAIALAGGCVYAGRATHRNRSAISYGPRSRGLPSSPTPQRKPCLPDDVRSRLQLCRVWGAESARPNLSVPRGTAPKAVVRVAHRTGRFGSRWDSRDPAMSGHTALGSKRPLSTPCQRLLCWQVRLGSRTKLGLYSFSYLSNVWKEPHHLVSGLVEQGC